MHVVITRLQLKVRHPVMTHMHLAVPVPWQMLHKRVMVCEWVLTCDGDNTAVMC